MPTTPHIIHSFTVRGYRLGDEFQFEVDPHDTVMINAETATVVDDDPNASLDNLAMWVFLKHLVGGSDIVE